MACSRVILVFIFVVSVDIMPGETLYKDDFCPLKTNKTGVCKDIRRCSSAQYSLVAFGEKPGLCSFDGLSPIVCCEIVKNPDTEKPVVLVTSTEKNKANETVEINSRLSTSQTKCLSFSNYVYRNETSPILLPGIHYVVVNSCMMKENFQPSNVLSGEFPHLVSIGFLNKNAPIYKCTGALISEDYILTTATCTSTNYGVPSVIRLGTTIKQDFYYEIPEIQHIGVQEFIKHPNYDPITKENDLALIKLEKPAIINALTRPACLPEKSQLDDVIAVGYSSLGNYGEFKDEIKEDTLHLKTGRRCPRGRRSRNNGSKLCGELENKTCILDEGAPLQILNKSPYCTFSIVGLVSSWDKCDTTKPMVVTDVSKYVNWIEKNIWY